MQENNFKSLQSQLENDFLASSQHENTRTNVFGTLSFVRYVGHLVENFIPRIFDLFIIGNGGDVKSDKIAAFPPHYYTPKDPRDVSPGRPEGDENFQRNA